MSHAKNKVDWCLKKAEKEIKESGNHRGLIKSSSNVNKSRAHIIKAEHYLKATMLLKKESFSDISASTVFYAMYHCLLAICAKFGYESRNQECTFALIHCLVEEKKIELEKELIDKIASFSVDKSHEQTSIELREQYQYGTELSLKDDIYDELVEIAKNILIKTKVVIEK